MKVVYHAILLGVRKELRGGYGIPKRGDRPGMPTSEKL